MTTAALLLPKPERVEQRCLDFPFLHGGTEAPQGAGRIRFFKIGGRMDLPCMDAQHGGNASDGARRSQGMTDKRLGGADGNLVCTRSEDLTDGFGFHRITDRRGRRMGVDVIDLRCRDAGIGHGEAHRGSDFFAVFPRDDHMIGLAGRGVAGHFCINAGFSLLRMGGGFQHEGAGAFPHHESVTRTVEGTRGSFGLIVVFGRERAQGAEARKHQRRDAGIGTDRDHHVGTTLSDALHGLP